MGGERGALVRPFAALFPGQGSQHPGMGKDLADTEPAAAAVFRAADETLGFGSAALCFAGPEAALVRTEITQPAILTVAIAAFRAFAARGGVRPSPPRVTASASTRPTSRPGRSASRTRCRTCGSAGASCRRRCRKAPARWRRSWASIVPRRGGLRASRRRRGREPREHERSRADRDRRATRAPSHGPATPRSAAGAMRAIPLQVSAPFHCALMEPAARRLPRCSRR